MPRAFVQPLRSKKRKLMLSQINSIARQEIQAAMDTRIKPALTKSLDKVVADWKHKPAFQGRLVMKDDSITVYVYPIGENKDIFKFVDQGTEPHIIRAKNAPRLAFQMHAPDGKNPVAGGYVPKTLAKPARTVSGGGYVKKPTALVRPMEVDHPGSEGRGFTKQIATDIEPYFKAEIDAAFKRAARRINGK